MENNYKDQRAYFAAHAPEVPDWFNVEPKETMPEIPRADKVLSRTAYATFIGFVTANYEDDIKEIDAFNALSAAASKVREQWQATNSMRRIVAWRWAYADAMMAGVGK